jgi:hypothetical protein
MKPGSILLVSLAIAFVSAGYFGVRLTHSASPEFAGPLAADKGYGVTIDLTQYHAEELAGVLTSIRQRGLRWIRQPVRWSELEPAPGEFEWQQLDRIFDAVVRENAAAELATGHVQPLRIIIVLHATPRWARPSHQSSTAPPVRLSNFGRFARAFATRYGDQLDHYQIWHEPNLSTSWGNTFVDPESYARLLREAALNIRAADPQAVILTAALAPTLENGPLNLNELDYLDGLYRAGASRWFDIVAGQPYGFDSEPTDPAQPDTLNFSRLELLRQVMLGHGDADTPVWATAFGWNALPPTWTGPKSPWKHAEPEVQARRTAGAVERARRDWPWLGPLLAVRWDATTLALDDPARGFALSETPPVLAAIEAAAKVESIATPGYYPASHPSGDYDRAAWRFSPVGADIPRASARRLTITFEGTRLDLTVNRGLFRGYLWVTIDGQPANALPRDDLGRSYAVLYDPLREPETITLARNLASGRHQAVIEAEGGWGQWVINGWTVHQEADLRFLRLGLLTGGLLAVVSGIGLYWVVAPGPVGGRKRLGAWVRTIANRYDRLGEPVRIIIILALGLGFLLAPAWLGPLFLVPLALAILWRPDLGLALIAFSLSVVPVPRAWSLVTLSPLEMVLLLVAVGFFIRKFFLPPIAPYQIPAFQLKSADWAALSLLVLSLAVTLFSDNFGVSMFGWRTIVLTSVALYFLVRLGFDCRSTEVTVPPSVSFGRETVRVVRLPKGAENEQQLNRWVWRLVDAFVAGATLHALGALILYFFVDQYITVEGVRRAVGSVYDSPNHLALYLGRVWPILLAISCLPHGSTTRRALYGAGLVPVSLAIFLTFSKGALLLGLPAAVLVMAGTYLWRYQGQHWPRVAAGVVGGLVLLSLVLLPFGQTARVYQSFGFSQGSTGFFRLKVWQASVQMLRDNWLTGVGVDNFLYQYRTRYILPQAWQEPNLSHAHNVILDFGTRLGLAGIGILLWLQIAFWTTAWRRYQHDPRPLILGLIGSMAVFLSHGLVDNAYFLVDLALAFFLVVGVVQRLDTSSTR